MKNRYFIIVGILIAVLGFAILGFDMNHRAALQKEGIYLVNRLYDTSVEFVEVIPVSDDIYGKEFAGNYEYKDAAYTYFVDINENQVRGIFINREDVIQKSMYLKDPESDLTILFKENLLMSEKGDIVIDSQKHIEGNGYDYIVKETINGIETGTKLIVALDESKKLVAAVFQQGEAEQVEDLQQEETIPLEEARQKALEGIRVQIPTIVSIIPDFDYKEAQITTFKGHTYWDIPLKAEVILEDGREIKDAYFEVRLDLLTGVVDTVASNHDF